MAKRKCGCVYADAHNTHAVRAGYEMGGYLKTPCEQHAKPTSTSKHDGEEVEPQEPQELYLPTHVMQYYSVEQYTELERALAESRAECERLRREMAAVWKGVRHVSPWSESNDMLWSDEVLTGIGLLAQDCDHHKARAERLEGALWEARVRIGAYGSAFDPPNTCRAFTYEHQPGNVLASRLGRATMFAASTSAGDSIDRGLGLLKALQDAGFGVYQLAPQQPEKGEQE